MTVHRVEVRACKEVGDPAGRAALATVNASAIPTPPARIETASVYLIEGDLDEGELEIGQISMYLQSIKSAKDIVDEIIQDFYYTRNKLNEY